MIIAILETEFKSNYEQLLGDLGKVEDGLKDTSGSAETTGDSLGGIALKAAAIGAAVAIVKELASAFVDVAKEGVETALRLNEIEQGFRAFTASAEESEEIIGQIRTLAEDTDFGFEDLEKASTRLLQMRIPADQVVQTMQAITNQMDAVEGSSEQLNAVTEAIGKINATGEVTPKVLKQIQMAGVDTNAILQRELGLTQEQIKDITKQNLDAATVTNALLKGMAEATSSGVEDVVDDFARDLKNLKDNVTKTYEQIGKELIPILAPVVKWISENLNGIIETVKQALKLLKDLAFVAQFLPGIGPAIQAGMAAVEGMKHDIEANTATAAVGSNAPGLPSGPPTIPVQPLIDAAETLEESGEELAGAGKELKEAASAQKLSDKEMDEILGKLKKYGEGLDDASEPVEDFADSVDAWEGELDEWTKTLFDGFKGADAGLGELQGSSNEIAEANRLAAMSSDELAAQNDMSRIKTEDLTRAGFTVETQFKSMTEAVEQLSLSLIITDQSIENLYPGLKGAAEAFQFMNKQIRDVSVGWGPAALEALKGLKAQQEGALNLLAAMDAMGFVIPTATAEMKELGSATGISTEGLLDMFKATQRHTEAVRENTRDLENATDTTVQSLNSVAAGIGTAGEAVRAGAVGLGSGLAQLGSGLGAYGEAAAAGELPGGLPGGVPSFEGSSPFSGAGTPILYGGGHREPGTGVGIRNPFGGGESFGGGVHGFPGGLSVTLQSNDQGFSRFLRVQDARWRQENSIGVR